MRLALSLLLAYAAIVHGFRVVTSPLKCQAHPVSAHMCASVNTEGFTSVTERTAQGRRGVLGRPASIMRGVWSRLRCSYDVCTIDFRPIQAIRRLFPRKRALLRLRFCEDGTYKINRADGVRILEFYATTSEVCTVDNLPDMF